MSGGHLSSEVPGVLISVDNGVLTNSDLSFSCLFSSFDLKGEEKDS